MPSFEEEAFNRAQQMHRRPSYSPNANSNSGTQHSDFAAPKPEPSEPQEPQPSEKAESMPSAHQSNETGLIDTLLQNKEQNLLLLLIILLMEENSEPTLLLALIYLLI